MSKKITFGLIQDKDTNLILYDESTRCDGFDWIEIDKINKIDICFKNTSTFLNTNHIFRFDNTRKAYVLPYGDFIPFDGSEYNNTKYMILKYNNNIYNINCNIKINNAQEMIDFLFEYFEGNGLTAYKEGNKIFIRGDIITSNIEILEGNLLDNLCMNRGIYRSNNFRWNNTNVTQEEFKFNLFSDNFDLLNELPEGYIDVSLSVFYRDKLVQKIFISEWSEFLYMQSEIYRAKIFEYIGNNFSEFLDVEQRWQTNFEIFMQKSVYFDSLYKAFLSSLETGNKQRSYELLQYIIDYKILNPIV